MRINKENKKPGRLRYKVRRGITCFAVIFSLVFVGMAISDFAKVAQKKNKDHLCKADYKEKIFIPLEVLEPTEPTEPVVVEESTVDTEGLPVEGIEPKTEVLDDNEGEYQEVETEPVESAVFVPMDIPLSDELQEHTFNVCEQYGVPYKVLFSIMWHETRYTEHLTNLNTNSTTDYGICQINSVNWNWLLADHGLDVSDTKDNIESAVVMLSKLMERYTLEQSLAAYACGENGMLSGNGFWFSSRIFDYMSSL